MNNVNNFPYVTFKMTGNAKIKNSPIKYKADFVEHIKRFNWHHTNLNYNTNVLIYSSVITEKYIKAQQMGIKCMTYEEVLKQLEFIEKLKFL